MFGGVLHQGALASGAICAVVKIEIRQELTLERQAFDAHMTITNGLGHLGLENIIVEVTFADEHGRPIIASNDPNNIGAKFFIRADSEGISANSHGSWDIAPVPPSSSSDLHWLIIPAPGSAEGEKHGKLYYVGARLSYILGGESHVVEVTPDYIFVKPLPRIALDYFLTHEVYGNDAWTSEIEPPVPFTLGVRVQNNGNNTAYELKIDSAQPEIIENEQGLLIGFAIEGSQVNGEPAKPSLLVDFGDIEPGGTAVGRWIMTCTLSGRFTEFTAEVSHADELGGELTSLIRQEDINTHLLVKDVLVDLPGRDAIHDFLTRDAGTLTVYESSGVDAAVADHSSESRITFAGRSGTRFYHEVTTPEFPGFFFMKRPDPHNGTKVLTEVTRSDGKRIKPANAWLSKERRDNPANGWNYFVNLFDTSSTGSYVFVFDDLPEGEKSPLLQFIPDKTRMEGQNLSFLVEASNTGDPAPSLFASNLPAMATFTDLGDGSGIFDWTPVIGQAGVYPVSFRAVNGKQEARRSMTITVYQFGSPDDGDEDDGGGPDPGDDQGDDGSGDDGNDGGDGGDDEGDFPIVHECPVVDSDHSNHAPTVPVIQSPVDGSTTDARYPVLIIKNSQDADGDPIYYDFELYSDIGFGKRVEAELSMPSGLNVTSWQMTETLDDDTWYYWRVRAGDEIAYSLWTYGHFFLSTEKKSPDDFPETWPIADGAQNDPPFSPVIKNPGACAWVDTIRPELSVHPVVDPEAGGVSYTFEICSDQFCQDRIAIQETDSPVFVPETTLENNKYHYWRVLATDEDGETRGWTGISPFFVRQSTTVPTISGTPDTSVTQGEMYHFAPVAEPDYPGLPLLFSIVNKPGWADFDPDTGILSGIPGTDHVGVTTGIVITVADATGASASLPAFDLTVRDGATPGTAPPIAVNDAYVTRENTALEVAAPGLLDNDIPGDGGLFSARLVRSPEHGNLVLNGDGSFLYIPQSNFVGLDSFEYAVIDGQAESAAAVVSITITPVNGGPYISPIDDFKILANTAFSDIPITVWALDEEAVVRASSDNPDLFPEGSIIIGGSGADRHLTLVPAEHQHGRAIITITATNSQGVTTSVDFTVIVRSKNDPDLVRYFLMSMDSPAPPIHVTSLADNNRIFLGDAVLELNRHESDILVPVEPVLGDVLSGTGHFSIAMGTSGNSLFVPETFTGRRFVIPHVRGIHTYIIHSPYGDASVMIELEDRVERISVSRGEIRTYQAVGNNTGSGIITSNLPVLLAHVAYPANATPTVVMDAYPVPPVSRDLWGLARDRAMIGALEDNTRITIYDGKGVLETVVMNAGDRHEIKPSRGKRNNPVTEVVHIVADKPVSAVGFDETPGNSIAPFLDQSHFSVTTGIPADADIITVVCTNPYTIVMLRRLDGRTEVHFSGIANHFLQLPRVWRRFGIRDNRIPYMVRFGDNPVPWKQGPLPAGSHIVASSPVLVIYETKAGNGKHNLLGDYSK